MNSQLMIPVSSASFALVSLIASLALTAKSRRIARTLATVESRVSEDMTALSGDLDTASRKSGEHGRRIAWLEARMRSTTQTRVKPAAAEEEVAFVGAAKPTMTERRHRVLSLARRG